MDFHICGTQGQPSLLLLPGLGVSHDIFLPLIERLQDKFYIIATVMAGMYLAGFLLYDNMLYVPLVMIAPVTLTSKARI